MAGGVKLSIYSTFKDSGVKQAEKAMDSFTRKFGKLDESTKTKSLDARTAGLAKTSIKLDQLSGKLNGISAKMQHTGEVATKGLTIPIVAGGTAAVKAAVKIDTALTGVRKTVNGTEEQYQGLKKAAIEYSKTNAVSADEVLDAQALGAQLGFNIDELDKFSQVATGLDIATNMDMETASSEMAQFANITNMAHDDIDRYGASIVNIGNNMATTESEVSHMAIRVAAAGKQVHMNQKEILGWSGAMTSMGIKAEMGGSAFSRILSQIDTGVATGSKQVKQYAAVAGMSADQFSKSWKKSASDTMQALLKGLGESDNMSVALNKMNISGTQNTDVMKRLASNANLVSQALKVSADGWNQNSALTNEVANRNSSLASKMQILKNRATAVAEEVGKPLADALLEAMSAAEPFFHAIENGAQAFANMDKSQQQAILKAAALVAGFGPVVSILGKVVGVAGSASGALAKVFANAAKASAEGGGIAARLLGSVSSLKGGLIGLGVAAAAAVAAFAISKWQEYQQNLQLAADSTKSFGDLQTEVQGKISSTGTTAQEMSDKTKSLLQDISNSNDNFVKSMSETQVNSSMLDTYTSQIANLTSKTKLSVGQQMQLKAAVQGYNSITGDSVSVTNAAAGELSKATPKIMANAAAWKENAKNQAYQQLMTDATKQGIEASMQLTEAKKKQADAQKRMNEIEKTGLGFMANPAYRDAVNDWNAATDSVKKLTAAEKSAKDKVKAVSSEMTKSAKSTNAVVSAVKGMGSKTSAALKKTGTSAKTLGTALSSAGIKAKSMAGISDAAFARMWSACNGDVNKMKGKIREWNHLKAEGKHPKVTASGNVIDGSAAAAVNNLRGSINSLQNKTVRVTYLQSQGYSKKQAKNFQGPLLNPKRKADGGTLKTMARGGIATGPVMYNRNTLIGEDGAEAYLQHGRTTHIYPIENHRYMRPLARSIAAEMPKNTGETRVTNVYYTIDGMTVAPGSALATAMDGVFANATRLGRMNEQDG